MNFIDNLKQKVRELKKEIQVLLLAYTDPRTPLVAKVVIGLTVGYLLSPIDLIPDFIPVIGLLDDLVIVPLLILLSIRLIPPIVLNEARQEVQAHPEKLKRNNWIAATAIVLIWALILYITYRKFGYLIETKR